ncbi:DUF461 domain-containing protein [Streptomyces marincola]|uniref:DUF461 domain-containing protein n=1 Tax=Streptomyces marincola TaxID=2878388 RepID=UPI001CF1A7A2|nr:DUF461 domain-containing protein [Streptomyces marincola]UCM88776.1 DUF461 domain-containing protein [Streptomyces marincola]
MSSSLRRGVAAAFFAFSAVGATACGAGVNAETGQVNPDNASAAVDDIDVQNVNLVLPEGPEGPGGISARLFNSGSQDQTLDAVVLTDGGAPLELVPAEGESSLVVPARGSLALGGEGNAAALLSDPAAADVALGNAQGLSFVLSEAGEITLSARVVGDTNGFEYYEDWGPTPTAPEEPGAPAAPGGPDEEAPGGPGTTPEDGGEEPQNGTGEDGTGTGEEPGGPADDAPDAPGDGTAEDGTDVIEG